MALAEELGAIAPAALIVEDVHWADDATLDVVRLLARRAEAGAFLLVLSDRSDQVHRDHPLRLVLGELPEATVTRLELHGLSREAVGALAAESELDAVELFERTAGNPFVVTETLAAGTVLVPGTVRDAVHARVARLSPEARALLDAVAIVPQRAEVWLLEALTEGALGALDECLRSGVRLRRDAARRSVRGGEARAQPRAGAGGAPRSRRRPGVHQPRLHAHIPSEVRRDARAAEAGDRLHAAARPRGVDQMSARQPHGCRAGARSLG